MAFEGVFHRQLVQAKFFLHLCQFMGIGVLQSDPDKALRAAQPVADVGDGNVGAFVAVFVNDAVDEHP